MAAHIPQVSRLSARIIRMLGCNPGPMTLQGTNTYIVGTGKRRILIDAGEKGNAEYKDSVNDTLKDEGINIEHIIITHWHGDHIGGLHDILPLVPKDCSVWKFKREGVAEELLPHSFEVNYLNDGDIIKTDGATLKIVHTPGHTTDHIVLTLLEENSLFSGDCILGEGTAVFEDLYDYMHSLNKILDLKPNVIYPGHGPVIEEPTLKIQYYIDHRNSREQQIIELLQQEPSIKMTTMEIVKVIYKDTPEHLHQAAAFNVDHHLNKLLRERKVKQSGEFWETNKLTSFL